MRYDNLSSCEARLNLARDEDLIFEVLCLTWLNSFINDDSTFDFHVLPCAFLTGLIY